jgi:hypothetical protein
MEKTAWSHALLISHHFQNLGNWNSSSSIRWSSIKNCPYIIFHYLVIFYENLKIKAPSVPLEIIILENKKPVPKQSHQKIIIKKSLELRPIKPHWNVIIKKT